MFAFSLYYRAFHILFIETVDEISHSHNRKSTYNDTQWPPNIVEEILIGDLYNIRSDCRTAGKKNTSVTEIYAEENKAKNISHEGKLPEGIHIVAAKA